MSKEHMAAGDRVKIKGFLRSWTLPSYGKVGQVGTIVKRHPGSYIRARNEYGAGTLFDVRFDDGSEHMFGILQLEYVSPDKSVTENKSSLDLLKEYRAVVEGRINGPEFTLVDRTALDQFMTKRGFVKFNDPREHDSETYTNSALNLKIMIDTEDDFWTIEDVAHDEVLEDGYSEGSLKKIIVRMIRDVRSLKEGNEHIVKGSWIPGPSEAQFTWRDRNGIYLILPGSNSAYGNNDGGFDSVEDAEEYNQQKLGGKWKVQVNGPVPKQNKFNTCSECDGKGCPECEFTGRYDVGVNSDHYL